MKGERAFPPQLTLRLRSWGIHAQYFDEEKLKKIDVLKPLTQKSVITFKGNEATAFFIKNETEAELIYNVYTKSGAIDRDFYKNPGWYLFTLCDGGDYSDYWSIICLDEEKNEWNEYINQFEEPVN